MMALEAILDVGVIWLAIRLIGFGILAATCAGAVAFLYRNRIGETLPDTAGLIVGLGVVAVYLNTRLVLVQFVGDDGDPLTIDAAFLNLAIFAVAGVASIAGQAAGHRIAAMNRFAWSSRSVGMSPIVRATGRTITVTLPDEIGDIDGYDPVTDKAKAALAGRSFDFPRGLTIDEVEEQLTGRLTEQHDVGYVDVDLVADGTVEYLAIGQGPAGLGETLAPGTAAVALSADPAFSASPGDTVEIWRGGDTPESIGMGELRAAVEDTVTIACDRSVATAIDPTASYRLVTHAADETADREFVTLLRHAPETMSILAVEGDTPLVGTALGELDADVLAVQRDGDILTIPDRDLTIRPDDRLYLLGRPDHIRRVEAIAGVSATPLDSSAADAIEWAPRPGGGTGKVRDGR